MSDAPPAVIDAMNSFDPVRRSQALAEAAALLAGGKAARPSDQGVSNVHAHTFFSYSSRDYSPTRLVWEAVREGLTVIGSTDFDVLDAMDEMYAAGDALAIRSVVSLETRTFVDDYADREINSPGEPGVLYAMGVGFTRLPDPAGAAGKLLASLSEQSRRRNEVMVDKVNAHLGRVRVDYGQDVLPLTPSGNATERHICAAYDAKARAVFPERGDLVSFWSGALGLDADKAAKLLDDIGGFRNAIRAKLMKKGGPGYAQPGSGAFPPIRDFFAMVKAANAVPCLAWLDGASAGEADPGRLLDDAMAWGARIVNVIPERNWNIADPEAKKKKLAALDAFVKAARRRDLPVLAGTEMNSPGQKFVDTFDAPEIASYAGDFQDAAFWLYGHTVLERFAGLGATSAWAAARFVDWAAANAFYVAVGKKATPSGAWRNAVKALGKDALPDAILTLFA